MFTGRDAFPEHIGAAALLELATPPASDAQPDVDSEVAALIDECLQKEPALRPTMEAVAHGIEFNPPEYRFVWLESVHQADFRIRAHGAPAGTVARKDHRLPRRARDRRDHRRDSCRMGDRYMRDVIELRAGEQWQPRLCEMIESADVFQLFWS